MRTLKNMPVVRRPGRRAFTLIELLTVLVIIGILAGLTVSVAGIASRRSKVTRTQAELSRLDLAIRDYKARFGFYPPDNVINAINLTQNPVVNQLYYELSGARFDPTNNVYIPLGDAFNEGISRPGYVTGFGNGNFPGIYNSAISEANVKNFLSGGRGVSAQVVALTAYPPTGGAFAYQALTVPVAWPANHMKIRHPPGHEFYDPDIYDARFSSPLLPYVNPSTAEGRAMLTVNPWRYNATNPTNNPGEFDLWADIVVGNEFITIGNWKEE
jgi:prepilin-type N-terminal cleavage/methylation domain-containing protein